MCVMLSSAAPIQVMPRLPRRPGTSLDGPLILLYNSACAFLGECLGGVCVKRTFQPHNRQYKKVHGFLSRMSTRGGQKVIKARRLKGRKRLAV